MTEKPVESQIATQARFSWLFPLLSWLSQIILGLALRNVLGLGVFWTLLAVGQLVLMILGLYCALKVLALGRRTVAPGSWKSALLGLILSGGSLLLIAGLILALCGFEGSDIRLG